MLSSDDVPDSLGRSRGSSEDFKDGGSGVFVRGGGSEGPRECVADLGLGTRVGNESASSRPESVGLLAGGS